MATDTATQTAPLPLDTEPGQYKHWKLSTDGPIAHLTMDVSEDSPLVSDYKLKLNSYDLGVDIELADAVNRLRFEHPEVKAVVVKGARDRIFCAGANIFMLGSSTHAFKVNFCKFTNETRIAIEDACANSGQHYLAACNGTTAGGGYELAMACEKIYLVDDGNAAVSLPEVPLLGVLPGTGGLTRLVDKRKVRRDRADVFCTLAEGVKGKRAVEWGLVDEVFPRTKFDEEVKARALAIAKAAPDKVRPGIRLGPVGPEVEENVLRYRHVQISFDRERRTAEILLRAPEAPVPSTPDEIRRAGSDYWPLRAFRELDDLLVRLRFEYPEIGVVVLRTQGEVENVLSVDRALEANASDWLVHEIRLLVARVLRRLDQTAKSLFAIVDAGSCFAGTLFEIALAADRSYMFLDDDGAVKVQVSPANAGWFPMAHGPTRLQNRFSGTPGHVDEILAHGEAWDGSDAEATGLVTIALDEIDWDDEIRIAIEERANFSPDALTGMEANLRVVGPENMDSKVFGRLTAWQNWIFQRPNAVGEFGALSLYGKPERPRFDWRRT